MQDSDQTFNTEEIIEEDVPIEEIGDEEIEEGVEEKLPEELPVIPISDAVVYPFLILPLMFSSESLVQLTTEALSSDKLVALFAQRPDDNDGDENGDEGLYPIGTAGIIIKKLRFPNGSIRVVVQGLSRIRLQKITSTDPYIRAKVEQIAIDETETLEVKALMRNALQEFQKVVQLTQHLPNEMQLSALNIEEPGRLADFIAANLDISLPEKQLILKSFDIKDRLKLINRHLVKEVEVLELGSKIQDEVKEEMDKDQREYYLREQMQAIRRELGEDSSVQVEIEEFRQQIEEADMPEEAQEAAEKELSRLEIMSPAAAEYTVSRTYLDWLISLPWSVESTDNLNLKKAEKILDADHYGMRNIKDRIIEYLAVRKLKKDMKGPIFCFVGPPGVGKTSLGRSIARALGRKFYRFSLGGIRDEAEIRGHRRTYIGSLPGRILQGIRYCGSNNPVFMLDEIDKMGMDFRGDPASALLEALDPEQNREFSDHYLEIKFDLSKVMFITTANHATPIPHPLLDRMEVMDIPGYTTEEKLIIAKQYLVPRQLEEHGINPKNLVFEEKAVSGIIKDYTREAGVRNLERELAAICRKTAKKVALGKKKKSQITPKALKKFLGSPKFIQEISMRKDEVGVATGLAWTEAGGTIMFIEAIKMKGKKNLTLTGSLGDVMKESAQIALSLVRSRADDLEIKGGIHGDFFNDNEIHIHVPAGAVPKDGPSAGITMAVTLASLASNRPVRHNLAMTGELTLRGQVLPIGGVKEKVLAAREAGIRTVILPDQNRKDMENVPKTAQKEMTFKFVKKIDDLFRLSLLPKDPPDSKPETVKPA
ncbi:MAG: endopeptidase La [Candidatus Cloacimonetes bacterium 4572_55]|nr:MAG: endopeptidase La [Candidatus Cloacimonetes bacterium 4572_55]